MEADLPEPSAITLHATTVAIDGVAVVLEGPSGSGKSDLALRLIDRGATLISDDRTRLVRQGGQLVARAPERLAGSIEVRGLGIVDLPYQDGVPVALLVRLGEEHHRLPERRTRDLAGVSIRALTLDPHPASAPLKVEWALRQAELPPA